MAESAKFSRSSYEHAAQTWSLEGIGPMGAGALLLCPD